MLLKRPQLILLDLDGTLVDSAPDLALSVDAMRESLGLPAWGEAKVREWIGNGAERLVRRALVGSMEGEPDEALFLEAYPRFLGYYREHICMRSTLYPGVLAGLDYLHRAGYVLSCITNKPERFANPLLRHLGLIERFALILGGDTLEHKKPHPEPLFFAARRLGVTPGSALMVGDSVSDVQAARAAGFRVVCVSYGYNHGRDIREAEPDAVIDSLLGLQELLEQVHQAASPAGCKPCRLQPLGAAFSRDKAPWNAQ
jgi:2-phosphoglycolate phosphatase, prokaryotic